jgi:hypothetical protein
MYFFQQSILSAKTCQPSQWPFWPNATTNHETDEMNITSHADYHGFA